MGSHNGQTIRSNRTLNSKYSVLTVLYNGAMKSAHYGGLGPTLLSRQSDQCAIQARSGSCQPSVYYTKMGESRYVPFPTAQQVNLPTSSPHCPFNAERQAGKL